MCKHLLIITYKNYIIRSNKNISNVVLYKLNSQKCSTSKLQYSGFSYLLIFIGRFFYLHKKVCNNVSIKLLFMVNGKYQCIKKLCFTNWSKSKSLPLISTFSALCVIWLWRHNIYDKNLCTQREWYLKWYCYFSMPIIQIVFFVILNFSKTNPGNNPISFNSLNKLFRNYIIVIPYFWQKLKTQCSRLMFINQSKEWEMC